MSELAEMTAPERRRELLCREWMIHRNGTRAYLAVYDADGKMSDETAAQNASRMLRNAKVSERLQELEARVHEKLSITKEKIEREIASIAHVDVREFYREDGTFKSPQEWSREMAAAVKGMEVQETFEGHGEDRVWTGYIRKLQFWDKLSAGAILGAQLGIGVKRIEVGRPGDFQKQRDEQTLRKSIAERGARAGIKLVEMKKKSA